MLDIKTISNFRNGVCAIGLLPVPIKEFAQDPLSYPPDVVGTGFLVAENYVLTNSHVLEKLRKEQGKNDGIPDEQLVVDFTPWRGRNHLVTTLRMVRNPREISSSSLDVALIEIQPSPTEQFRGVPPLKIQTDWDVVVTEKVFAVGYPFGSVLLERKPEVRRFGPVIQQGYISAIAPFDRVSRPTEILLDLQAARGMSGSPIISYRTGCVIGILYEIYEEYDILGRQFRTTTAFGIPLAEKLVESWIAEAGS